MASSIRTRVWRNGVLEKEDFPFAEVADYLAQPDCLVWADLLDPDHAAVCLLAEELQLDEHAVEDALAHHERPKATRYATHVFMTTYAIGHDKQTGDISVGRVSAFSTRQAFVTVRLNDSSTSTRCSPAGTRTAT